MIVVAKLETQNWMRNPGRTPMSEEEVAAMKLREVNSFCFPLARVIKLCVVVAVAKIVDSNIVALNLDPCGPVNVGLPGPIIRGL